MYLTVLLGAADACQDRLGRLIPGGEYFVPDDPCRTCLCDGGIAVACAVMQCSQPECEHWQRIEGECCTVKCIQLPAKNSTHNNAVTGFTGTGIYCMFSVLLGVSTSDRVQKNPDLKKKAQPSGFFGQAGKKVK